VTQSRRLYPIPGQPFGRCSYSKACKNVPTLYYEVPTLTRGRNHSTRTIGVCPACAQKIRLAHPEVTS
jgi:hypothetical protein